MTYWWVIIADLVVLFMFSWVKNDWLPSWVKGSEGEEKVLDELKKLPKEFLHVADFYAPGQYGNVDFVVIGPTGIFAIEAKNTSKKSFDYNFEKYLRESKREAVIIGKFVKDNLQEDIWVIPILVYTNRKIKVHYGEHPQDGVFVVGISWLNKIIQDRPIDPHLTPEVCEKLNLELNKQGSDFV